MRKKLAEESTEKKPVLYCRIIPQISQRVNTVQFFH